MKNDEQKYTLTVTESQLRLIADCVEDMSRFMGGQMELWNATSRLDNFVELKEQLNDLQSLVTPELPRNASYGCGIVVGAQIKTRKSSLQRHMRSIEKYVIG